MQTVSSLHLASGALEVRVDLSMGRIVFLGRPGGANALWMDPEAPAHPMGGWINHGGEKAWLWPQEGWKGAFGSSWPPPCEAPGVLVSSSPGELCWSHALQFSDGSTARLIRTLDLNEGSLNLRTRLECGDSTPARTFRPWSVLQLPRPRGIRVRAAGPGRRHPEADHGLLREVPGGWALATDTVHSRKWFFDADRLEADTPAGTLVMQLASPDALAPVDLPPDTAQVFILGDGQASENPTCAPYIELEFVSPNPSIPLALRLSVELDETLSIGTP